MDTLIFASAGLLMIIGLIHSVLGEKYILTRLFKKHTLPRLFGGTEFTQNTLRFAWHLTTVAWFGLAFILILSRFPNFDIYSVYLICAGVLAIHALVSLVGSKGKHLSWVGFLAIAVMLLLASNAQ